MYTKDRLFSRIRQGCVLLPIFSATHLVYITNLNSWSGGFDDFLNCILVIGSSWVFFRRHQLSNSTLVKSIGALLIITTADAAINHSEPSIVLTSGLTLAVVGLRFYSAPRMLLLYGIHLASAITILGLNTTPENIHLLPVFLIELTLATTVMYLATLNHEKISNDLLTITEKNDQNHELLIYYERLFTDSPDGILIFSCEKDDTAKLSLLTIERCNQAAANELGRKTNDLVGRTMLELSTAYQTSSVESARRAAELDRLDVIHTGERFDWAHQRIDGSTVWHNVSIKAIQTERHKRQYLAIWRNIDTRRRLEDKTATLLHELEKRKNSQEHIFGIVSHELRTPIAMSSMLLNERDMDLAQVKKLNQHALSILDNLKNINGEHKNKNVELENVKLEDVIKDVVRSLSVTNDNPHLMISILNTPNTQGTLITDPQALRQVAGNIILNCVRHSHAEHLWIRITGTSQDQAHALIVFEDDGEGISPEFVDHLFDAGKQEQETNPGLGLGLNISRELARDQLNGDVTFCARAGGGSIFSVKITPMTRITPNEQHEIDADCGILKDKTILLTEDSPTFLELTKRLLERYGARVDAAENGLIGLKKARETTYDVVLTDISMPELDGYEFTKALRSSGYQGMIIVLTAVGIGNEEERIMACGANHSMTKPIDLSALVRLLERSKTPNA